MADTEEKRPPSSEKPSLEMKKRALKYYNENMVPKHLEKLLNNMFYEDPPDIYGYMSDYFGKLAKEPVVSHVTIEPTLGSHSHGSALEKMYCTVNGKEKLIHVIPLFVDERPMKERPRFKLKSPTSSKGKKEKTVPGSAVKSDVSNVTKFHFPSFLTLLKEISCRLESARILNQEDVDGILTNVKDEYIQDENLLSAKSLDAVPCDESIHEEGDSDGTSLKPSSRCEGCTEDTLLRRVHVNLSCLHLSLLAAVAASHLKECTLFQHLMPLNQENGDERVLPLPMIPVLSAGVCSSGKVNMIKTVYMTPKLGSDYVKAIENICEVVRELGIAAAQKYGMQGHLQDDDKILSPPFEKPDHVFDLLQSAVANKSLTLKDFHLVLDIAAGDYYDEDKSKYEIATGQAKVSGDLISMYEDLLEKFPIVGLIDPLSRKDVDNWLPLNNKLKACCHVFTDAAFDGSLEEAQKMISENVISGCQVSITSFGSHSLSQLQSSLTTLRDFNCQLMMTCKASNFCALSTVEAVDLAIIAKAMFIDIGSPNQSSNIPNYNRLLDFDNNGTFPHRTDFCFQVVEEEQDEDVTQKA